MLNRAQIALQQQQYLSYLPYVRAEFGNLPGVELIGLGAKERKGKTFEEWAFRFYVNTKLPLKDIPGHARIPTHLFGIQTDVIAHFEKESLICDPSLLHPDDKDYYDDGLRGGITIRNEHFGKHHASGSGTLGVIARWNNDGALVALTCAHVANAASLTPDTTGTRIGHPKYYKCCCPCGYIGDVIISTLTNDLDCAIIYLDEDNRLNITDNHTENKIQDIEGDITGAASIMCFEELRKRGRTTGLTFGKVKEVAYGTNQMLIESNDPDKPFACHGDSGAVIVNSSNKVVGLLVAAAMEMVTEAIPLPKPLTNIIATHIKYVMAELDISIAGTRSDGFGVPVDGGPEGCEIRPWPGGQTDTALNPLEIFTATDFGFPANADWDVSLLGNGGASEALIVEKDGVPLSPPVSSVTDAASVSIRYDKKSISANTPDAIQVKATANHVLKIKFRTAFTVTARPVNTNAALDTNNTKRFFSGGGTNDTTAGVATPGVDGATWFLGKAEIAYDISPADISWNATSRINFVAGAATETKGNIRPGRLNRFSKGIQVDGDPNRVHENHPTFIPSLTTITDDSFQGASDAVKDKIFCLANEGFFAGNLLQGYLRADFQDFLEIHIGRGAAAGFVRITPLAEWFANLTGALNSAPPPLVTATEVNTMGAGTTTEDLPNHQPVIAAIATQEVRTSETNVTLTAVPTDADNDMLTTVEWAQTSPAPVIALTPNPAHPLTSVRFTAPAVDRQLIFSATVKDSTEGLFRAPAVPVAPGIPNFQSVPVTVIVNVVEWLFRIGGYPDVDDDQIEVFTSAQFGFAGNVDWDVSTGGTAAIILETGIAVAGGLASITVRYGNVSADQKKANTVVIKARQGVNSFFKRRTVLMAPLAAWPGGQVDTGLNPVEVFTAAGMGFAAGTLLNWNVGLGGIDGVLVGPGGTTTNGVDTITVRYNVRSPNIAVADAVWIQAINPANGQVAINARTVFRVDPQAINTTNLIDANNALRYPVTMGAATTSQAGTVNTGMAGISRSGSKVEQIWDILPQGIPWSRRLVTFVFDLDAAGNILLNNTKFQFRCRRERIAVVMGQAAAGGVREIFGTPQDPPVNDATWTVDGFADPLDCQYPTNALPDRMYRHDAPAIPDLEQGIIRANFREFAELRNDTAWVRITPFSAWFANAELVLPAAGGAAPVVGGTNNSGAGAGAVNVTNTSPVINAGPDQVVGAGTVVTLNATVVDANNDTINNVQWNQLAGPAVVLAPIDALGLRQRFVVPAGPARLTFSVFAEDLTVQLNFYNPGNARSNTDVVNVDVN